MYAHNKTNDVKIDSFWMFRSVLPIMQHNDRTATFADMDHYVLSQILSHLPPIMAVHTIVASGKETYQYMKEGGELKRLQDWHFNISSREEMLQTTAEFLKKKDTVVEYVEKDGFAFMDDWEEEEDVIVPSFRIRGYTSDYKKLHVSVSFPAQACESVCNITLLCNQRWFGRLSLQMNNKYVLQLPTTEDIIDKEVLSIMIYIGYVVAMAVKEDTLKFQKVGRVILQKLEIQEMMKDWAPQILLAIPSLDTMKYAHVQESQPVTNKLPKRTEPCVLI